MGNLQIKSPSCKMALFGDDYTQEFCWPSGLTGSGGGGVLIHPLQNPAIFPPYINETLGGVDLIRNDLTWKDLIRTDRVQGSHRTLWYNGI